MGTVGVLYKVYPKEGEFENVAVRIKKEIANSNVSLEEIGFGITVVKVFVRFEDKSGITSTKIEEQIKKVEGVSEVEITEESLL